MSIYRQRSNKEKEFIQEAILEESAMKLISLKDKYNVEEKMQNKLYAQ